MDHSMRSLLAACVFGVSAATAVPATPIQSAARPPVPPLEPADLGAWLDGFIPSALVRSDIAGLVVSVVKNGQIVIERGYGYADLARKIPMDPERTVIRVASLSKSFTATAVMRLVEEGKLDLDRDVNDYLDFRIPAAFGAPITLRHLLTHTAGFEETSYKRHRPPLTLRQDLATVPERIYPPGTVPAYSNYGLNLAGYIVTRVSGLAISEYVERNILGPLSMTRSVFRPVLPPALEAVAARNYSVASAGTPYPPELILELAPTEWPAAGLTTTAHDMTRFMLAHLQQGRYHDYQLLRPETLERMHAPAFVPIPGALPVALGLFRTDYRGHRVIGHSGDGEGFHAEMRLLPDDGIGIFIAMNSDGAVQGIFPAAMTLRATLFERFVDRYSSPPVLPEEPTVSTAKEHARLAAGEYAWSRRQQGDFQEALALVIRFLAFDSEVRANPDGTIETPADLAFPTSGRRQTWREVGPFVWREVGGGARLVMDLRDGRVRSFWTDQAASTWVNLRVPFLRSASVNVPLLGLSALALVLTVVVGPVAAAVRRRRGTPLALDGAARRAARLTRIAALLGVLYLIGWAVVLVADLASRVGVEHWIRLVQVIGLFVVAGSGVALWNAVLAFRGNRNGWSRAWSVVLVAALADLVWFSFAFHLISARLD